MLLQNEDVSAGIFQHMTVFLASTLCRACDFAHSQVVFGTSYISYLTSAHSGRSRAYAAQMKNGVRHTQKAEFKRSSVAPALLQS